MTWITCVYCDQEVEKPLKEIKRQKKNGAMNFFCSYSCAAKFGNAPKKRPLINRQCKYCHKDFQTIEGVFCSSSCASRGSMTDKRISAAIKAGFDHKSNLIKPAQILKIREKWKYAEIEKFLNQLKIVYEIEFQLENRVYDLALLDKKILIEFDGQYHRTTMQKDDDNDKDNIAKKYEWVIYRIPVKTGTIFSVNDIKGLV